MNTRRLSLLGLVLLLAQRTDALATPPPHLAPRAATPHTTRTRAAQPPLAQLFGKKKEKIPSLAEQGYWEGEWVCADCGYIYEPDPAEPFEELPKFWKCPQCAGPRRRFVKKAGDVLGNLDDSGLFAGTAAAALVVIAAVYIGLTV